MLVYDGNELVVHYVAGETDYIVITFESAGRSEFATQTFLAEKPILKNKVSAIGVTAKVDHWYISPDTENILTLISLLSARYQKRVVIGYSMGAYAALAFSRRLGASVVFAAAPKWSLDPAECENPESFVKRHFRDGMQKMAISSSHIQGNAFIAYDPYFPQDAYHAQKFREEIPNISFVPIFYARHDIFTSLSGSRNFLLLLNALLDDNCKIELSYVLSKIRRHNVENIKRRIESVIDKNPRACVNFLKIIFKRSDYVLTNIVSDLNFMARVISGLCRHMLWAEAGFFQRKMTAFSLTNELVNIPEKSLWFFGDGSRIITWHGTLLTYDFGGKCFHGRSLFFHDNNTIPVRCLSRKGRKFLGILLNGQFFFLVETDAGIVPCLDIKKENSIEIVFPDQVDFIQSRSDMKNFYFYIRTRQGFVCASPEYHTWNDSKQILPWEIFSFLPLCADFIQVEE